MNGALILDAVVGLFTLTALELVLGIDNLVFVALMSGRLPEQQQARARRVGLMLAWMTRLLLLASAVWLSRLTVPWFTLFDIAFTGRDCFFIAGGIFLLVKATQEIHGEIEPLLPTERRIRVTFFSVVSQIAVLDIIFSLDSVITAVGLTQQYWVMAAAITFAIIGMIFAAEPLTRFIERRPTVRMLALSFLILIGMVLVADGCHVAIPKGYIYFSMCFSLLVEFLNQWRQKRRVEPK